MRLEFPPEEGSIGQYESPSEEEGGEEGRRDEEGAERRERGGVTSSSARESIALWDKRGISHIPVYLCNRKRFGEVEEAADLG